MTAADLDALARANYEALTTGRYVRPWASLRDCDKWRFIQGALAVLRSQEAANPSRPSVVVKAMTDPNTRSDAAIRPRWWERKTQDVQRKMG